MNSEDLYDIGVQRAWEILYDIAEYLTPEEWETAFEVYITGYMQGALDIFTARIKKEGL